VRKRRARGTSMEGSAVKGDVERRGGDIKTVGERVGERVGENEGAIWVGENCGCMYESEHLL